MTPELEREMIVGILSVFFTALFTGIPAFLLFWWTWQRDQERLVVKKLVSHVQTITGQSVIEKDRFGPTFGILIRNRSLYPVHLSALGFAIDGKVFALEHPLLPMKMKRNPDSNPNRPYIPDDSSAPSEIPSQASTSVDVTLADRLKIGEAVLAAAEKHGLSVDEFVMSEKVVALAATESGEEFTSMPRWKRLKRLFEKILLAPQ